MTVVNLHIQPSKPDKTNKMESGLVKPVYSDLSRFKQSVMLDLTDCQSVENKSAFNHSFKKFLAQLLLHAVTY